MLVLDKPADLLQHVGEELGPSEWFTLTQEMIDKFADAVGDHQWIHVDVERAKRDLPGGKTLAHGYLTLSLISRLSPTLMRFRFERRRLILGSNRVRFTAPVPVEARVRLQQKILKVEPVEAALKVTFDNKMEIEGSDRPALIAQTVYVFYG